MMEIDIQTHYLITLTTHAKIVLQPKFQKVVQYKSLMEYLEQVMENIKYKHLKGISPCQDSQDENSNFGIVSRKFPLVQKDDVKKLLQGIKFQLPDPSILKELKTQQLINCDQIKTSKIKKTVQEGECPLIDDAMRQKLKNSQEEMKLAVTVRPSTLFPNIKIVTSSQPVKTQNNSQNSQTSQTSTFSTFSQSFKMSNTRKRHIYQV